VAGAVYSDGVIIILLVTLREVTKANDGVVVAETELMHAAANAAKMRRAVFMMIDVSIRE